ncbi:MAG: hypothetical protein Q8P72_05920 [Candidatus Roizmanbacteria bacterium]|nr:hypothetical protein [Candidatus Roizmanbacteria bacterium]
MKKRSQKYIPKWEWDCSPSFIESNSIVAFDATSGLYRRPRNQTAVMSGTVRYLTRGLSTTDWEFPPSPVTVRGKSPDPEGTNNSIHHR